MRGLGRRATPHEAGDVCCFRTPRTDVERHRGHIFKIGIGPPRARTNVVCLVKDLDIGIIDATTGEILGVLTLDTTRTYRPTGLPQGGPRAPPPENQTPEPITRVRVSGMSRDITMERMAGIEPAYS